MKYQPIYLFTSFFAIFSIMSCSKSVLKTYQVKKIDRPIELTGRGQDVLWDQAIPLTDFSYPWREETAPATTFKALWTDSHFFFLYRAADTEIITKERGLGERDPVDSDRVEIFFKANDKMDPYYALEMDALGRLLDTEGRYHRNIDFDWNWPEGELVLQASRDNSGYVVEGSISFASLEELGMYKGDNELQAGLYRGEYVTDDKGEIATKWISWVMPDSETPDFHIPSSFGLLKLID